MPRRRSNPLVQVVVLAVLGAVIGLLLAVQLPYATVDLNWCKAPGGRCRAPATSHDLLRQRVDWSLIGLVLGIALWFAVAWLRSIDFAPDRRTERPLASNPS